VSKLSSHPLLGLPNMITMLRLLLVPVFAWTLLAVECCDDGPRLITTAIFLFASATDLLDGHLARSRAQVTRFGIIADPIADKALTGTALVGLSIVGDLWWWATIAILVRELAVTIIRFRVIRIGVMAAGRGGKAKTAVQITAISLYLLSLPDPLHLIAQVVMVAAVVITVVTGVHYVIKAMRLWRSVAGGSATTSA
jgi:CDP-diacylglycerol---glycerol-3-phosphate 3-phosphatidyltransferase